MNRWAAVILVLNAGAAAAQSTELILRDGASPTTTYAGTRDVRIEYDPESVWDPTVNYSGQALQVDGVPVDQSALLRWELSPYLGNGVKVASASITLHLFGDCDEYGIYAVHRPWVQTEATGNEYRAGMAWAQPGATGVPADRSGTPIAVLPQRNVGGSVTIPLNAQGLTVLQAWIDGTEPNHGFIVQGITVNDGANFPSMNGPVISERPKLTVTLDDGNTFAFQNGLLPSSTYSGGTSVTIANGKPPGFQNGNPGYLLMNSMEGAGSLLAFDVSPLPSNAVVSAARLVFNVWNSSRYSFDVYAQLRPWTEDGAAWRTSDGTTLWAGDGNSGSGDHDPTSLGVLTATTVGTVEVPLNAAGVQWVQQWVSGTQPNHGFFIHSHTVVNDYDSLVIASREALSVASRPALVVTYTAPLTLTPQIAQVTPGQQVEFLVTGGAPGSHTWSLTSAPSGATLTQTGLYTAGPTPGAYDVVSVRDSLGAEASAKVYVEGGIALSPSSSQVPAGGHIAFTVQGGTAPFTFGFEQNHSGGTLSGVGEYTAGAQPGLDRVFVTDAMGLSAVATIDVVARAAVDAVVTLDPAEGRLSPGRPITVRAKVKAPTAALVDGRARLEFEGFDAHAPTDPRWDETCGCFRLDIQVGSVATLEQIATVSAARQEVFVRLVVEDAAGEVARVVVARETGYLTTNLGCGCGSGGFGAAWAVALLALLRRRRSARASGPTAPPAQR